MDIMLDKNGDLLISEQGDIVLGDSVAQKITSRLKMFEGEWRWNQDEGLPYFEYLFQKKPDTDSMEAAIRSKIFEVTEVTDVQDVSITVDPRSRSGTIRFVALTDQETIKEEVKIQWQNTV
jgi:hypothetical protein